MAGEQGSLFLAESFSLPEQNADRFTFQFAGLNNTNALYISAPTLLYACISQVLVNFISMMPDEVLLRLVTIL